MTNSITKKWQTTEGKKLLKKLINTFGEYKFIQIIGWNGEQRYFKVKTERIITRGIKAEDLLDNKYGKEISEKELQEKKI